jgi:tetratricopeptide (TPR) repeat protein
VSLLRRWIPKGRVRRAAKRLAKETSARNYALLAQEYAVGGELDEVLRVCNEGLQMFPGNEALRRLLDRTKVLFRQDRTRALTAELQSAPRPALWRELCEILIDSGRVDKAEDVATEWYEKTHDGEALLYRAQSRAERFFADRRMEDGRQAFELAGQAEEALSSDPRPLRLRVTLATRCGAWQEARRALARLLELHPGDPALEARFRTVVTLAENAPSIERALRQVERTGRLADDEQLVPEQTVSSRNIRPLLQNILREPGVQAAFYVRGGTALVQGPRGATAERTARGMREIVTQCRTAARRLGLGQAFQARIEGDWGTLLVAPGEVGSGALWCAGPVSHRHEEVLRDLAGIAGQAWEVQA